MHTNTLHKFLFDGLPIRGVLVQLGSAWYDVQAARSTPLPSALNTLMGELAAAALLLQGHIKFNGAVVLQIAGDGALKMAVAEVQPDLAFRVMASRATQALGGAEPQAVHIDDGATLQSMANPQGTGRCAVTLDPLDKLPGQQPYQGIVPLSDLYCHPLPNLAAAIGHYMRQSEQLDTQLVLAANATGAAGILVQKMPTSGAGNLEGTGGARGVDAAGGAEYQRVGPEPGNALGAATAQDPNEDFNRIASHTASLKAEELLTLDAPTLLHRLFWEEAYTVYESQTPRFACRCSRGRVASMLQSLGLVEVQGIVEEKGEVGVDCEFCGAGYTFSPDEAQALFV